MQKMKVITMRWEESLIRQVDEFNRFSMFGTRSNFVRSLLMGVLHAHGNCTAATLYNAALHDFKGYKVTITIEKDGETTERNQE